jgi:exodeoxyribonuclease V alpha subunit
MRIECQGRVDALNARLHERLRPPGVPAYDIKGFTAQYYTIGDPVMWLRNDYSRGFFSGLIGQVKSMPESPAERWLEVLFDGESSPRTLQLEDLMDLTLAHAITCHKLQGSQAARAVAPIYESRLLDPSWVYTAITPAERQVIIFWATWPCCTWFSKGPGLPKIAGRIRVAAPR